MTLHPDIASLQLPFGLSSISALFLSVFNWLKARKGASIQLTESYRFGIYTYQSGRKLFYFPLDIMNIGNRIGKVDQLKYEITNPNGKTITLFPKRKVKSNINSQTDRVMPKNFQEVIPTLPVFCPPSEGKSIVFEYYEEVDEKDITQKEILYNGKIHIKYNGGKKTSFKFSFKIPETAWNQSGSAIIWIPFS